MNSIINQLPAMKMGEELKEELSVLPEYDTSIRNAGVTERLMALETLYDIYVPSDMSVEIYSKLYLAMLRSLRTKEGNVIIQQRYENHKAIKGQQHRGIIAGSDCFTIIGTSGRGKSTAIGRAIAVATENIIIEMDKPLQKIVPVVICQCPHDCSVKAMLLDILRKVDEVIGTNYCEMAIKARATTDMLIGNVSTVALNHIGLLVIDEIQNVVNHRNGNMLVGMLTQLINNSSISVCMVGTLETELFFERTEYLARRALGLRYEAMSYENRFKQFCEVIYGYQYVKRAEPFSESLAMWLYEHSGGVPALVVSLLHDVQEEAILNGTERVDIPALEEVYKKQYGMMQGYKAEKVVNVTKKKKTASLQFSDQKITIDDEGAIIGIIDKVKAESLDPVVELRKYIKILEVAI